MKQEKAVEELLQADFVEVEVSKTPPRSVPAGPRNAPVMVFASGDVAPTEPELPQVFAGDEDVATEKAPTGTHLAPNWTLREGDLGLETWTFTARRVGRRAFVQFQGVIEAQTPTGMVTRAFVTDPADERGWFSSSALPGRRYVDFEFGATARQVVDFTVNWGHEGRVGWGVGPVYDFDRGLWDVRAQVRVPLP